MCNLTNKFDIYYLEFPKGILDHILEQLPVTIRVHSHWKHVCRKEQGGAQEIYTIICKKGILLKKINSGELGNDL